MSHHPHDVVGPQVSRESPAFDADLLFRALDRGLIVISGDSWATDVKELDSVHALGSVLLKVSYTDRSHSVVELEEGLVLIALEHGRATLTVAGYTSESVTELLARVKALLPAKVSTSDAVSIAFLAAEFATSRSLVVPAWEDIKANYPASVAEDLTSFIDRGSKQSGRLLLWHGLPGTGKTYALRALAREWRELVRCAVHPRSREVLRRQHGLHDGQPAFGAEPTRVPTGSRGGGFWLLKTPVNSWRRTPRRRSARGSLGFSTWWMA